MLDFILTPLASWLGISTLGVLLVIIILILIIKD